MAHVALVASNALAASTEDGGDEAGPADPDGSNDASESKTAPAAPTETAGDESTRAAPAAPPSRVPDFMRNKRRMRDEDLEDKREGGYFTGLPLLNSDPDTGVGFGARLLYFHNGARTDDMFAYTPYRHRASARAFLTTNGYQYYSAEYDAPYILDSPVRLRATVYFEKNIAANYFGVGPRSLGRLAYPGADRGFDSLAEYTESQRQRRPDGTAYTRYDQYIFERPYASVSVERDFFGGIVRGLAGLTGSYVSVRQWTGREVSADAPGGASTVATEAPTRLQDDCARGVARGCGAGFNNTLKLGVAFDTRDFEPNPSSGWFIDFTTELASRALGSDFTWARATFAPRVYWSPFPRLTKLVLAARLVGSAQTADTPVFALPELSFTDGTISGLGGLRTLRGYKQNRFVGRAIALANVELRWRFWEVTVGRHQHLAFMLAPFFDVGRVFDTVDDFELRDFRHGQGAGLRVAWNQASVIVFDFGASREGTTFYVNFGHPF